jgi:hypothetical protein
MPDFTVKVDNKGFNEALAHTIAAMKKDAPKETMRQGKLLALAIASAAPPRIRGLKGLAAGIPKAKADSRFKVIKRLFKAAYSMRVIDAVRMGPTEEGIDVLWGISKFRSKPVFKGIGNASRDNALQRILFAAQKDTMGAMRNLQQLLKKAPGGPVPQLYQDYNQRSSAHYKRLLDKMGKSGLGSISQSERIYLREPINRERKKVLAEYIPTVGTLKAGWVQAAMAIPSNAGRKPPSWLLNKKLIGSAAVIGSGFKNGVVITNQKGNAIGFNTRTDYVGKALRFRRMKMLNAIKAMLARKFKEKFNTADTFILPYERLDDYDVQIM